jgi:hypothetical protein
MPSPGEGDKLSFERDIKPLFRTMDRDSMMAAFDLFDYEDVAERADAIVGTCAAVRCRATARGPPPRWTNVKSGLTRASPLRFATRALVSAPAWLSRPRRITEIW